MDAELAKDQSAAFLRHQTYLARYGAGLAKELLLIFDDQELIDIIRMKGSTARINSRITKIINGYRKEVAARLKTNYRQLAAIELDWVKSIIGTSLNVGGMMDASIKSAMNYPLVVVNSTVSDMLESSYQRFESQATTVNASVRADIITDAEAVMVIKANYLQLKRSLETNIRTSAFSIASQARENFYKSQPKLVRGVIIAAVLDGRTTNYCKRLDGTIFPLDEGPRPPFHPNCRTMALPVFRSESDDDASKKLQFRAQVGPGEEYEKGDNKLKSTRRNIADGTVNVRQSDRAISSSGSYGDFLKYHTKTEEGQQFIRDTLGKARGNLFIKRVKEGGKISDVLEGVLTIDLKTIDAKELIKRKKK